MFKIAFLDRDGVINKTTFNKGYIGRIKDFKLIPGSIKAIVYLKSLNYKVIVIKDIGAVVNQNLSENAEEMLHCFANVLLRLQSNDDLQHLTQNQETELLGWDAEKYRKSIQR